MPGHPSPIQLPQVPNFVGRSLGDTPASMLKDLGGGGPVKVALPRAAERAGLHYWRAFDIWYGKARRVEDHEVEKIKTALGTLNDRAARNELRDLKARLARLEARLADGDADFHRPTTDFLGETLRLRG